MATTIRAAGFRASTAQMLAAHPFGGPAHTIRTGMPLGEYVTSHEEWCFDPFLEKAEGILSSYNGIVLGKKGVGKTSLMKLIAYRFATIGAGTGFMRIAVNDHRSEGGRSEYAPLGDALGASVFDIATRNVNPFEASLKLGELSVLEMATMLCEHVNHAPIIGSDFDALKVAVWMMRRLEDPLLRSIEVLMKMCLLMSSEDIKGQQEDMDGRMRGRLEKRARRFAGDDAETSRLFQSHLAGIYAQPSQLAVQEILQSRFKIASLLGMLLEGKYGRMLGGSDSLYDMYSKRIVIKDWRGVTGEAVSLMRAIDHLVIINAIERDLFDMYPNIELDDEDHRSMENLTYARSKALKSKIARSARLMNISGSHRLSDYRKGGVGSELWSYGQSIISDMDYFLVGQQTNRKEDLDELQDLLQLTTAQRNELPTLPKYMFGAKIGEMETYEYVRPFPTPTFEAQLIKSNRANDAMVDRPGLHGTRLEEVAAATGFDLKEKFGEEGDDA